MYLLVLNCFHLLLAMESKSLRMHPKEKKQIIGFVIFLIISALLIMGYIIYWS